MKLETDLRSVLQIHSNCSKEWQYLPVQGVEQRLPGRHGAKSSPREIKIVTFSKMPHRESSTVVFIHRGSVGEVWGNMLREDTEVWSRVC